MLDWRILAASFTALLVVSAALVGNFGITDFFSDILDKISEWLGSSPFGGIFSQPKAKKTSVSISLYPSNFSLRPDFPVNITLGNTAIIDFKGEVIPDFENQKLSLVEASSPLRVESPLKETRIENITLNTLFVNDIRFTINSAESNITTENGSMEIHGFFGLCVINTESIQMEGNVSIIRGKNWEIV